jgi:hypothetical protein
MVKGCVLAGTRVRPPVGPSVNLAPGSFFAAKRGGDGWDMGEQSDAVLRTAMPGPDGGSGRAAGRSQKQWSRGRPCTGTTRPGGVRPAISSTSLVRVASLNWSRSWIAIMNEPGPPMTQSS